ncbi:ribose transport system substrate-binding protein [Candidatus Planktophila versatilis]|uniref:Ribose transport system substrate-binding protein n=1 Tax=Candidatus Planktophila versatilis TaxID=1884905 RepID=A0AAC9YV19_9ACTN|nr:substrate-binding domain-containing protein [Candidatus Planktophila versatilis]ASY22367.1 ribose transport system substrate-binding protein [Candidatus Planktophila versatilis]
MKKYRSIIGIGVVLTLLALTGCSSGSSDENAGSTEEAGAYTPVLKSGIPGALLPEELKLWKYDFATAKYTPTEGDAKSYVVNLVKPDKTFTLAHMDGWATNPFAIPIAKGIAKLAKDLGLKLIYCDAEFKPEKAISCAEILASQKPDFVIAGNWQGGAAAAIMAIFDKAKIPAASIDVSHPNAIFFGASNYASGVVGGKAAGEYAKATWDCKDVWVFMGENLEEGEAADLRLVGFADGVQEVCGALPADRIQRMRLSAGTADQAITVTTDWLTAHPEAKHILSGTIDDERANGMAKAFAATKRDGMVVGQGCDSVGIAVVKMAPASENRFLGCAAYYPEKYGDYLVSIALDVMAGKAVPQEIHMEHSFLDHDTIGTVYK